MRLRFWPIHASLPRPKHPSHDTSRSQTGPRPTQGRSPTGGSHAKIADIEVIAVRYYDDRGEEIGLDQHHHDAAWQAVEQNRVLLKETCTDAGHRDHAGRIDPIRFPEPTAEEETSPWRMAPSARQRIAKLRIRKQG